MSSSVGVSRMGIVILMVRILNRCDKPVKEVVYATLEKNPVADGFQ